MPITFACPKCRQSMTRPDAEAGTKTFCTICNQKLLVPIPPRATDKTMLGELQKSESRTMLGEMLPGPVVSVPVHVEAPVHAPHVDPPNDWASLTPPEVQPSDYRTRRRSPKWPWIVGGAVVFLCFTCAGVVGTVVALNLGSSARSDRANERLLVKGQWVHAQTFELLGFQDDHTFFVTNPEGTLAGQWSMSGKRIHCIVGPSPKSTLPPGTTFDMDVERLTKTELWLKHPMKNGWIDHYRNE